MGRRFIASQQYNCKCTYCNTEIFCTGDVTNVSVSSSYGTCICVTNAINIRVFSSKRMSMLKCYDGASMFDDDIPLYERACKNTQTVECINCCRHIGWYHGNLFILVKRTVENM